MKRHKHPRKQRPETCLQKRRYDTQPEAEAALVSYRRNSFRSDKRDARLRVYPCETCGGWHYGTDYGVETGR